MITFLDVASNPPISDTQTKGVDRSYIGREGSPFLCGRSSILIVHWRILVFTAVLFEIVGVVQITLIVIYQIRVTLLQDGGAENVDVRIRQLRKLKDIGVPRGMALEHAAAAARDGT